MTDDVSNLTNPELTAPEPQTAFLIEEISKDHAGYLVVSVRRISARHRNNVLRLLYRFV